MAGTPFIVFGLPRSRTAWLARFLSYGDWHCGHEELRHVRSLDDASAWLSQPCTGTAETAGAPFWRLLPAGVRVVTVRRPMCDVVDSLMRLMPFERVGLERLVRRLDAKLDQIERRIPGVLSVRFSDLADEATCKRVFEHCLPYEHDPAWWAACAAQNIQVSLPVLMRYFHAHRAQISKVEQAAVQRMRAALHKRRVFTPDNLTISEVPFNEYFPGALAEIREHAVEIGEGADYPDTMNFDAMKAHADAGCLQTVIAKSNGRVLGYLLTVLQPCFIDKRISAAHHTTIWASGDAPGTGMRMLRFADQRLADKGCGEIIARAGLRGDGPRLGVMYRRLGFEDCGQVYRLGLEHAA